MIYNKDFHLRLATAHNLLAKQDKHTCLEKAYEQVAGEPWPYGNANNADYAAFATEFVNALAGSKVKLSPQLPMPIQCAVLLTPASAQPPKSSKRGSYTLHPLTENDDLNLYKKGIAVQGEWLYATNDHALAKIRDDRWQQFDGKLLLPSSFALIEAGLSPSYIDAKPPIYEKVIPSRKEYKIRLTCNLEKLLATIYGTWQLMCLLKTDRYAFVLRFSPDTEPTAFRARLLYETLRILQLNGASTVELCSALYPKPLSLYADNGNVGLVMSMQDPPDSGVITEPIDVSDFVEISQGQQRKNRTAIDI